MLQWGRGPVTAEMRQRRGVRAVSCEALQWGCGPVTAEMSATDTVSGVELPSFNGAAVP